MASSGKDSTIYSSDDDEVLRPVVKRKKRSKTIVSDSEEEDSDIEIKPRRVLKPLRYESEDENNNSFNNISSCSSESKNRTESLNDLSDNEQAEKCAICLSKFLGQDIATPETCDHVFCLECLQEWAKNVNTCPIDRLKFNLILIRHHKEDKIIKTIVVNNSALTYYSDSETESQSQTDYCDLCGEDKNEGAILRCHGCRKFYHYRCVLSEVPSSSDSWQCPACENYIWGRFDRMTPSAFRVYHSLNSGRRTHSPNNSPLRTHSSSREFVRLRRRFLYPRTIIRRFLSSSDSSDEDAERTSVPSRVYQSPLISSVSSKARCPLLGKRRSELYRSRNQALVSTATSAATESRSLYTGDSDDGDNDYRFSSTPVPENFDLVGSILQSQTLLHCPDILTLTRDGTLLPSPTNESSSRRLSSNPVSTPQNSEESAPSSFHNSSLFNDNPISPFTNNTVAKQRPLNPTHNTSTKYGETPVQSYTCSSSGASMERPLNYDESSVNRPSLGANNNERFGNEPCSPAMQRSFCSASTPEDMKKDNRPVKGQHSEDEVDIYSDIESVGEEGEITSDSVEPVKIDFKCDDSQLSNPNDSSDSSDNDLVIDEDQHLEEDNDKMKEHPEPVGHSTKNSAINNNEAICESEESNMSSNAGSDQDQLMIDTDAQNMTSSHMANSSDNCYNPDESSHGAFVNDESNNSKSNLENTRQDESDSDAGAQESDVDMQGYEENSLDSTKKSNQGDASTPCTSVKSSPKSYRGETADGFEMQCDNSVSNENSRCDNISPYEQEESKEVFEEVSNLENENTCDSISREAEPGNFLNENNSNSSIASQVERNENFQNENNSNFSFASDQPNADTSEPEEFIDSNAPQECEGRTNNAELIDICNEISMKSDEDDNLDSLENASTPCLDENLDGQIENSPIRCENFEGDGQDFETASPNTCDNEKENDANEPIMEKSEDDTGANSTKDIDKDPQEGSVDLGIEDISDAGSEDIGEFVDEVLPSEHTEKDFDDVERKVASLFSPEHIEDEEQLESSKQISDEFKKCPSSHSNQSFEDHEEGEIIEERPVHRCRKKKGRFRDDTGEYGEFAPRVNISSLPRIPKLKRDRDKDTIPETISFENKRTSVLSRVDLGGADIGWKRLSKHTRERSYRDGRPKDEKLLYRERESRKKDKNSNDASRRNDSKNSDRRREDKKQELEKSKVDYDSRSRKTEKSKSGDRSYSEREKKKSRKDKHSKDKHSKEKKEKDRYDKKYSKDEDKYDREKLKDEIRYERELRYDKEERFERIVYEKGKFKDKDHKSKHKDRKSDNSKSCKEHSREKHKHTHSNDHFSDKQREREVRKIDDKLKIVVEQKENRKDKSKHKERKEIKHEKKQILQRKVENERSPYTEPTSIESKEIFAKGDSIIINVNFNRAPSPKISASSDVGDANSKDRKILSEEQELDEQLVSIDKTKSAFDNSTSKRPTTPPEKNTSVLSVSESYWQGGDDPDGNNTPSSGKSSEETCAENEAVGSINLYDPNSCSSPDIIEIQSVPKDNASVPEATSLTPDNETSNVSKENDSFSSKRRSPRSPSPPSPADNDSYDPCEPTRSPSPPPMPPAPPLPTMNPKPPPSPELPPLPPEPEPMEESQIPKQNSSEFVSVSSIMVSSAAQPVTVHTQTSTASPVSMQSMLLPPPSFLSHVSSTANSLQGMPPLVPARNGNFQMSNHAGVILPSNHVQPIMSNFMPHMHGGSTLPPPPNPPNMSHMSSVPPPPPPPASMTLLSQARHPRLNVQPPLTPNSLLQSLTMVHGVNAAPVQLIHHLPPNLSGILANHQSPIVCTSQNQPTSLPVSITNQQVLRMVFSQNQVSNHSALLQNQNTNNCNKSQGSSVNLMPSHTQTVPIASLQQKSDKHSKHSPSAEKNEVIDMEVDTPYSPGDSPSIDSVGDYSPTCSPVASSPKSKDVFDSLLSANQRTSDKRTYDAVATNEKPKQHSSSKKSKHEHKRHSVRMLVKDKYKKSKKEQKQAEKKESQLKLEDTQLKILDELPSSAVEMQVKEKFLKKLNRQERVVEEVKLCLKPYYKSRDVTKEEYKDILRKSVPKICHNKTGEINPVKVKYLVECYVKKAKHSRKKGDKRKSKFS